MSHLLPICPKLGPKLYSLVAVESVFTGRQQSVQRGVFQTKGVCDINILATRKSHKTSGESCEWRTEINLSPIT